MRSNSALAEPVDIDHSAVVTTHNVQHQATVVATALPSELGWIAVAARGRALVRLVFGQASAAAALAEIERQQGASLEVLDSREFDAILPGLAASLQAYAAGRNEDFADVPIDVGPQTPFQRRVVAQCRRVAYGQTLTYAQLADRAGSPRAARAVGNVMASNPLPLVVPCHRIVAADGGLGGYSAPGGTRLKLRLLETESRRRQPAR